MKMTTKSNYRLLVLLFATLAFGSSFSRSKIETKDFASSAKSEKIKKCIEDADKSGSAECDLSADREDATGAAKVTTKINVKVNTITKNGAEEKTIEGTVFSQETCQCGKTGEGTTNLRLQKLDDIGKIAQTLSGKQKSSENKAKEALAKQLRCETKVDDDDDTKTVSLSSSERISCLEENLEGQAKADQLKYFNANIRSFLTNLLAADQPTDGNLMLSHLNSASLSDEVKMELKKLDHVVHIEQYNATLLQPVEAAQIQLVLAKNSNNPSAIEKAKADLETAQQTYYSNIQGVFGNLTAAIGSSDLATQKLASRATRTLGNSISEAKQTLIHSQVEQEIADNPIGTAALKELDERRGRYGRASRKAKNWFLAHPDQGLAVNAPKTVKGPTTPLLGEENANPTLAPVTASRPRVTRH
jgi:hypothetical protein